MVSFPYLGQLNPTCDNWIPLGSQQCSLKVSFVVSACLLPGPGFPARLWSEWGLDVVCLMGCSGGTFCRSESV